MSEVRVEGVGLDEIAHRHGTDKSTAGHGYTQIYERYLAEWRAQTFTMLEIGIDRGASLRMWRDYFPSAQIVGIDKRVEALEYAEERVEVCVGDQADPAFLEEVSSAKGPFDLVVDDGSHRALAQKTSLRCLWPHVNPGGLYVIEDIQTSYRSQYGMGWREPETTVEFLKYLIDDLNASLHKQAVVLPEVESMHFYDGLFICRKGRC